MHTYVHTHIHDRADDSAHRDFAEFVTQVASRYAQAIVSRLLIGLGDPARNRR